MSTKPHLYSVYADDPWYIALVDERDELHAENERLRARVAELEAGIERAAPREPRDYFDSEAADNA